ncbi:activator-dependent family glycosyltransferase [Prauserella cavernicola]|uniref:Activator-dependent family glycosyltransferase n=1 Tax=Prauserella cavernicola TaxID=2800127 RepID=A0A934V410_9PSEU|nr:activator-dependent family glycosyltransferase [Prauserella cavernicola]MBK1787871.1 activator-dependent family glycosyltransferase [Prauserella cavernicola]
MRVLFATYAEKTHVQPMVPLAWALRTAGHEVCVASQPELVDTIRRTGLTAVSVGSDHNLWRAAKRFLTARVAQASPETYNKVRGVKQPPFDVVDEPPENISWEHLKAGYDDIVASWYRMVNDPMLDELVEFARGWRPDLVVWESSTYAGAVAAKAVGAAHARLLCNLDMFAVARQHYLRLKELQPPSRREDALQDWITARAADHDLDFTEDMTVGQFTIDQQPDSLRMEADLHYLPMRYVAYNGRAETPSWVWRESGRPRVCLTLGSTSAERFDGYAVNVADIIATLSDLDIELVATLPDDERDKMPALPDNVRTVPFIALHTLAPTCSAVIHHGAFGTATTTASCGVPQLSLPERHDAPYHAERLARHGAGIAINYREATGTAVRNALVRLLEDPTFARRALALRDEMSALPSPNEVVPMLERMVPGLRTRSPGAGPFSVSEPEGMCHG